MLYHPYVFDETSHVVVPNLDPSAPYHMSTTTTWCCIIGHDEIFPVEINPTLSVAHLKKEIKKEKSPGLNHVPADELILHRANIDNPIKEDVRIMELRRLSRNLDECLDLDDEEQQLAELFGANPPGQKYFTLVQVPEGESI